MTVREFIEIMKLVFQAIMAMFDGLKGKDDEQGADQQ